MNTKHHLPCDPAVAETFPQFVCDTAAVYGDRVAVVLRNDSGPDESITFAELDTKSAELARGLLARGVGKGARIGFIFGNGPSFALMFAAIARVGAIAVPISTFIKSNELVRVLRQSDVAGLIVQRTLLGKDYVERLCAALPELTTAVSPEIRLTAVPYLRWIVSSGEALPVAVHDMTWLTGAAEQVSVGMLEAIESEIHPADQLMEIYTSGSMALPKGVKHNHGPTLYRIHYLRAKMASRLGGETMVTLPMFWVGGLMVMLFPSWESGTTAVCTAGTSTNSMVAMGSVLADDDIVALPEGFIIWALGMTETLGPYSYADTQRVPGYPLCPPLDHIADRYEVRVADSEGKPVADGEVGEIQVRGYALTPGLHKTDRDEYFTADGFFHTGDMGVTDGERIHFVGRNGDMIKTANTNVSPAEVELEMQQLEGVHSAYVVGIPDKERGQLVVAAVVPRDGAELDFGDIEEQLRQKLSSYKVPRAYVRLARSEVPMLPSNKVARREIETLLARHLLQDSA